MVKRECGVNRFLMPTIPARPYGCTVSAIKAIKIIVMSDSQSKAAEAKTTPGQDVLGQLTCSPAAQSMSSDS